MLRKTFDDMLDTLPAEYLRRITNVEYLRGLLDSGYGQRWRTYHNYTHICQMLTTFFSVRDYMDKQYSLFSHWEYVVAIMLHDLAYELGAPAGLNEENSWELALTYGPRCIQVDWPIVKLLIKSTTHDGKLDHPATQLIADLDLSTFESEKLFPIANALVRREYESRYTPVQVLHGRLEFLRAFRKREKIFYLDYFDNSWAFKNIDKAIQETEQELQKTNSL